ncbi:nucleotidyltransferase [uncultured Chryseobacterium sp.]|uniref:nucleotidyltransferase n=1 Tax=uncultured Chryseobacterium sp. TaxID=259322 RepID=UPI0025F23269|nr:nucleotidyltransferase [uncultured Chryseobacterium sp.]
MARKIEDIQERITFAKNTEPALSGLTSNSKTAVWQLWIYIVAVAVWTLETLFDKHKEEVDEALAQLKPHSLRWYRNKALAFQHGFDLVEGSDVFRTEYYDIQTDSFIPASEDQISNSKVIKYSAVTEAQGESRLIIKIATETNKELSPIPNDQKINFETYINEIKDAGVRITVLNYEPDILKLQLKIYRNPLVLDANGTRIQTGAGGGGGEQPVKEAIRQYMKDLPFNGELVLAHLTDRLQKIEGVEIPHILGASTRWIDSTSGVYGTFTGLDVKKIPSSGYFKVLFADDLNSGDPGYQQQLENASTIEYVV